MKTIEADDDRGMLQQAFAYLGHLIPKRRDPWRAQAYALGLTGLALLLRLLLAPLDGGVQYVTFFPAMALAAVVGGLWGGLSAAVVGCALASYLFWPPYATIDGSLHHAMLLSDAVFLADAFVVCSAIEAMHRFYRNYAHAENELRLAASVYEHTAEGVIIADTVGTIVAVNPAFTTITGYSAAEAIGQKPSMLHSGHQSPIFYQQMWEQLQRDGAWQGELWNRRKSGEAYLQWLSINRIDDDDQQAVRYVGLFHDITAWYTRDQHLRQMAFHDVLTGLANRALLHDRLEHAIGRARREGLQLALIFLDLDHFKAVNDEHGHEVGDLLLREVAQRIASRVRAMDTVARLGGDEFVVLVEDVDNRAECSELIHELIAEIAQPMALQGYLIDIGASAGVAWFPQDGDDARQLLKHADLAMYAAKASGGNAYRPFQQAMLDAGGNTASARAAA